MSRQTTSSFSRRSNHLHSMRPEDNTFTSTPSTKIISTPLIASGTVQQWQLHHQQQQQQQELWQPRQQQGDERHVSSHSYAGDISGKPTHSHLYHQHQYQYPHLHQHQQYHAGYHQTQPHNSAQSLPLVTAKTIAPLPSGAAVARAYAGPHPSSPSTPKLSHVSFSSTSYLGHSFQLSAMPAGASMKEVKNERIKIRPVEDREVSGYQMHDTENQEKYEDEDETLQQRFRLRLGEFRDQIRSARESLGPNHPKVAVLQEQIGRFLLSSLHSPFVKVDVSLSPEEGANDSRVEDIKYDNEKLFPSSSSSLEEAMEALRDALRIYRIMDIQDLSPTLAHLNDEKDDSTTDTDVASRKRGESQRSASDEEAKCNVASVLFTLGHVHQCILGDPIASLGCYREAKELYDILYRRSRRLEEEEGHYKEELVDAMNKEESKEEDEYGTEKEYPRRLIQTLHAMVCAYRSASLLKTKQEFDVGDSRKKDGDRNEGNLLVSGKEEVNDSPSSPFSPFSQRQCYDEAIVCMEEMISILLQGANMISATYREVDENAQWSSSSSPTSVAAMKPINHGKNQDDMSGNAERGTWCLPTDSGGSKNDQREERIRVMAGSYEELATLYLLSSVEAGFNGSLGVSSAVETARNEEQENASKVDRSMQCHRNAIDLYKKLISSILSTSYKLDAMPEPKKCERDYEAEVEDEIRRYEYEERVADTLVSLGHAYSRFNGDNDRAYSCYAEAYDIRSSHVQLAQKEIQSAAAEAGATGASPLSETDHDALLAVGRPMADVLVYMANVHYERVRWIQQHEIREGQCNDGGDSGNSSVAAVEDLSRQALELYQRALCVYREEEESIKVSSSKESNVESNGLDKDAETRTVDNNSNITEKSICNIRISIAGVLYNIGRLYLLSPNSNDDKRGMVEGGCRRTVEEARQILEESLLMRTSLLGGNHLDVGRTWSIMGQLHLNEYEKMVHEKDHRLSSSSSTVRMNARGEAKMIQRLTNAMDCHEAALRVYCANDLWELHPLVSSVKDRLARLKVMNSGGNIVPNSINQRQSGEHEESQEASTSGGVPFRHGTLERHQVSNSVDIGAVALDTKNRQNGNTTHVVSAPGATAPPGDGNDHRGDQHNRKVSPPPKGSDASKRLPVVTPENAVRPNKRMPSSPIHISSVPDSSSSSSPPSMAPLSPKSALHENPSGISQLPPSASSGGSSFDRLSPASSSTNSGSSFRYSKKVESSITKDVATMSLSSSSEVLTPEDMDNLLGNIQVYPHGGGESPSSDGDKERGSVNSIMSFSEILNYEAGRGEGGNVGSYAQNQGKEKYHHSFPKQQRQQQQQRDDERLRALTEKLKKQRESLHANDAQSNSEENKDRDEVSEEEMADTLHEIASIYNDMGEVEKAMLLYVETLRIRRRALGDGHHLVAITLNNLGELHLRRDEADIAMQRHGEALRLLTSIDLEGEHHLRIAQTWNCMGRAALQLSMFDNAMDSHRHALELYQTYDVSSQAQSLSPSPSSLISFGKEKNKNNKNDKDEKGEYDECRRRADITQTNLYMGEVYTRWGIFRNHETHGVDVKALLPLEIYQYEQDISVTLHALCSVGDAYHERGDYSVATKFHQKVLQVRKVRFGGVKSNSSTTSDHPDVASSKNALGVLYRKRGMYDKAMKNHRDAMRIYTATTTAPSSDLSNVGGENHVHDNRAIRLATAENLVNMGAVQYHVGKFDIALNLFQEALDIQRSIDDNHPNIANTLRYIGTIHEEKYDFHGAMDCFHDALLLIQTNGTAREMKNKLLSMHEDHPDTLDVLTSISKIYTARGEYDEAIKIYEDILAVQKRIYFPTDVWDSNEAIYENMDHPSIARTLHNYGVALARKGDLTQALRLYRDSLRMRRKVLGNDHPDVAQTLNSCGVVYANKGKTETALQMYYEALSIRKLALGEDHIDVGRTLNNIGIVHSTKGNFNEAMDFYNRAMRLTEAALSQNHPFVADTLINIGNVALRRLDYTNAVTQFNVALSMYRLSGLDDDHPSIGRALNMIERAKREENLSV